MEKVIPFFWSRVKNVLVNRACVMCIKKNKKIKKLPAGTMKTFTVCSQDDLLEFTVMGWVHSLRY